MRPLSKIARNILPEVGELQRGAGRIGKLLALTVTVAAKVQN